MRERKPVKCRGAIHRSGDYVILHATRHIETSFVHRQIRSGPRAPPESLLCFDLLPCQALWERNKASTYSLDIDELSDSPAIAEIAAALWGTSEIRGAAVMVGAGFSRFAELASADAPEPPLWSSFRDAMARALYPSNPGKAPTNPLRLAEEFRATRGPVALDALVRSLVRDAQWQPGQLHRQLLRLPWADVLTTNWDTLLERTLDPDSDRRYEPVRSVGEIARTRAPRIVKLHGTFPSLEPFIFTEEDFRTYPQTFAPFVNMAQQVLLENELCLIGFSGDDPNFLAWSGWVRDHLGPAARRIHLIGVLDLEPSHRRMLEQRNVSVIDLAPLVRDLDAADRHRVATERFFEALLAAKPSAPWKWERDDRQVTLADEKESIGDLLARWRAERLRYPGWLVAPYYDRYRVRMDISEHAGRIVYELPNLDAELAHPLLSELCWRVAISLFDLPDELLGACEDVAATSSKIARAERFDMAMMVAAQYRESRNRGAFDRIVTLAQSLAAHPDQRAGIAYESCRWGRDNLDYAMLEENVSAVRGDDPVWDFRRAQMLCHLGRGRDAAAAVRQANAELKMRRVRDRSSLWLLSREAWARFTMRGVWLDDPETGSYDDDWPAVYAEAHCDPWDALQQLRSETDEAKSRRRDASQETPLYDPGHIRSRGGRRSFAGFAITPWEELTRFVDAAGLVEFPNQNVVGTSLERAARLLPEEETSTVWANVLAIRSREGFIDECFGRIQVAQLDLELVRELATKLKATVEFGRSRLHNRGTEIRGSREYTSWVEEVRHRLELLSRLVVRLTPSEATELLNWGFSLCHDKEWDHWWLYEPLSHLLDRALSAIPRSSRSSFALSILDLPLLTEKKAEGIERDWPELGEKLIAVAKYIERPPTLWDARVVQLIQAARGAHRQDRTRALVRLLALTRAGVLTDHERELLDSAIWAIPSASGRLPGGTDLLPHVWLELSDEPTIHEAFRHDVIDQLRTAELIEQRMVALVAIEEDQNIAPEVRPDAQTAFEIACRLARWRRRGQPDPGDGFDYEAFTIGRCLAQAVLPRVSSQSFDAKFCSELLEAARDDANPYNVGALPFVAIRRPELTADVQRAIRRTMVSRDREVAAQALYAVQRWSMLAGDTGTLPSTLVSDVANLCSARHDPSLLAALRVSSELLRHGRLSANDVEQLEEALDLMLVDTAYANQLGSRLSPVTLTLVRAAAVALASELMKAGHRSQAAQAWLDLASADPMPEVRFALEPQGEEG